MKTLSKLIPFLPAVLLLLAFTNPTTPPRAPTPPAATNATTFYWAHDPAVSGTSGITNQVPKTVAWTMTSTSTGLGAGTLLATGTVYAGHKVQTAFTVQTLSMYVSVASTATAASTVFTITDGTNTCTCTFACNTDTNTTGVKDVQCANGAGVGCAYPAGALITYSVTTQGCATAATVKNIDINGLFP